MQNVSRCEWNPPRAGSAPPRSQVRAPCVPPCGGPELRGGLRWVRGCAEVTGYQLPLASASCASPPRAPHAGPGMSRCFHAPLSHESTHLSSPAAGMFGDVVDYVTVDHLSIIVWSPPWQFDWSDCCLIGHNFSSTERGQTELPQQTMLWAGLSSSGIQASQTWVKW